MKKLIYILICWGVSFCNNAFTQTSENSSTIELGVNVNYLLEELFYKDFDNISLIDYDIGPEPMIQVRIFLDKRNAIHFSGSFFSKSSDEVFAQGFGFGDDFFQKKRGILFQTGYEVYRPFTKKLKYFFGIDAFVWQKKFRAEVNFDDSFSPNSFEDYLKIQKEETYGIIPHFGLRYEFSAKISLLLKFNIEMSRTKLTTDTSTPFFGDPFFPFINDNFEKSQLKTQTPIVLFFNYKF